LKCSPGKDDAAYFKLGLVATSFSILFLHAFTATSAFTSTPPDYLASITPSGVVTLESQNFYLNVTNRGFTPVLFVYVGVPSGLENAGVGGNPYWTSTVLNQKNNYTISWGISNIQKVLLPEQSTVFGFSANVLKAGTYSLIVTEKFQDGTNLSSKIEITAISPSLGIVDVRYLAYILAAIALLLPISQTLVLKFRPNKTGIHQRSS
jgi:hypothetical protein